MIEDESFHSSGSVGSVNLNCDENVEIQHNVCERIIQKLQKKRVFLECIRKVSHNSFDFQANYLKNLHKKDIWNELKNNSDDLLNIIWFVFQRRRNFQNKFLDLIRNSQIWKKIKNQFLLHVILDNSIDGSVLKHLLEINTFNETSFDNKESILHRAVINGNNDYVHAILCQNVKSPILLNCPLHVKHLEILFQLDGNHKYPKDLNCDLAIRKELARYEIQYYFLDRQKSMDEIDEYLEQLSHINNVEMINLLKENLDIENISKSIVPLLKRLYHRREVRFENTSIVKGSKEDMLLNFDKYLGENKKSFIRMLRRRFLCVSLVLDILIILTDELTELTEAKEILIQLLKNELINESYDFDQLLSKGSCYHVNRYLEIFREMHGNEKVSELLTEPLNAITKRSQLHVLLFSVVYDICTVEVLIKHGACLLQQDILMYTPLHCATLNSKDNVTLIQILTETKHVYGGDCNASENCMCGIKSLKSLNQSGRCAKDYAKDKAFQLLNSKELMSTLTTLVRNITDEEDEIELEDFVKKTICSNKEKRTVYKGFFKEMLDMLMKSNGKISISICVIAKILQDSGTRQNYTEVIPRKLLTGQLHILWKVMHEIMSNNEKFFLEGEFSALVVHNSSEEDTFFNKENVMNLITIANFCNIEIATRIVQEYVTIHRESHVHLNNLRLMNFSEKFFKKPNRVRGLNLRGNQITKIDTLPEFRQLTELNLRQNKLKYITKAVFSLSRIVKLNLEKNELEKLPNEIQWSMSLSELILKKNKLKSLPSTIMNSCISYLDISSNKFQTFPACICDMKMLKDLNFDDNNRILRLPKQLGRLPMNLHLYSMKNMMQLHYHERHLTDTNLLLHRFRKKYYSQSIKKDLLVNVMGDSNEAKQRFLQVLNPDHLQHEGWPSHLINGVRNYGNINLRNFQQPQVKKLRIIEYPELVEGGINHYMLVKWALYVYVCSSASSEISANRKLIFWLNSLSTFFQKNMEEHTVIDRPCKLVVVWIGSREGDVQAQIKSLIDSNIRWRENIELCSLINMDANIENLEGRIRATLRTKAREIIFPTTRKPLFGGKVYSHYLQMEKKIRSMENKIMSEDDMRKCLNETKNNEASCKERFKRREFNFTTNAFDNTVDYLKNTGNILHLKDSTGLLGDHYFTDQLWFNEKLVSFVNHEVIREHNGHVTLKECSKLLPTEVSPLGFIKFLISIHVCFETGKESIQVVPHLSKSPIDMGNFESLTTQSFSFEYYRIFLTDNLQYEIWVQVLSSLFVLKDKLKLKGEVKYWHNGFAYKAKQIFFAILFFHGRDFKGNDPLDIASRRNKPTQPFHSFVSRLALNEEVGDNDGIVIIVKDEEEEEAKEVLAQIAWCVNKVGRDNIQSFRLNALKEYAGYIVADEFRLIPFDTCFDKLVSCDFSQSMQLSIKCRYGQFGNIPKNSSIRICKLFPEYMYANLRCPETLRYENTNISNIRVAQIEGVANTFAVKDFKVFKLSEKEKILETFQGFHQEVMLAKEIGLFSVDKENIVKFFFVDFSPLSEIELALGMVFEHAPYSSLDKILINDSGEANINSFYQEDGLLRRPLLFRFSGFIIDAIRHLHHNKILHLDIKTGNVLIFPNFVAKICDFGSAVYTGATIMLEDHVTHRAPEAKIGKSEHCVQAVDIWQFAILLYEMIFERIEFFTRNRLRDHLKLKNRPTLDNGRKDVPVLCKLIASAWDEIPNLRPSANAILKTISSAASQLFLKSISLVETETFSEQTVVCSLPDREHILIYIPGNRDSLFIFKSIWDIPAKIDFRIEKHFKEFNHVNCKVVELLSFDFNAAESSMTCFNIAFCIVDGKKVLNFLLGQIKYSRKDRAEAPACMPPLRNENAARKRKRGWHFEYKELNNMKRIGDTDFFNRIIGSSKFIISYCKNEESQLCIYPYDLSTNKVQYPWSPPTKGFILDALMCGEDLITVERMNGHTEILFQKLQNGTSRYVSKCQIDDNDINAFVGLFLCQNNILIALDEKNYFLRVYFRDGKFSIPERFFYGDNQKQCLTTACQVDSLLFIGTSLGSVFIYRSSDLNFLRSFRPYQSPVITMVPLTEKQNTLVTYGLDIRIDMFTRNRIENEEDSFELDKLSKQIDGNIFSSSDLKYPTLLLWDIPTSVDELMLYSI